MINSSTSWYKTSYPLRTEKFQQKLAENLIRKLSQSTNEIINWSINQSAIYLCSKDCANDKKNYLNENNNKHFLPYKNSFFAADMLTFNHQVGNLSITR